jgi:RNA polymerase sigma-70 factor (ECF subfamily)
MVFPCSQNRSPFVVGKYSLIETLSLDGELLPAMAGASSLETKVGQVFELLRDPVYRYFIRRVGDVSVAEDLTQEVFLRLYSWLDKGRRVENIRAWVFRVAHNLVIDQEALKAHFQSLDSAEWERVSETLADLGPSAERRLLEQEQQGELHLALKRLSPQERECLDLRAEGLSYREIAEVFDMRTHTLVSFLRRVVKKLFREIL